MVSEEDVLLKKAAEILGSPIELLDLLSLEIDKLRNLSRPDKIKLREIKDRLCQLHKKDLDDKEQRKEIEMDDLSKARSILNQPELTLEGLLNLDISKIKNLIPSDRKELTRIQNELRLAHQADLKDALNGAKDRKNLEKEEIKAVDKILGDKVDLEEFLDMDIKSIKDLSPDKQKELERLQDELHKLHDADVKDALEDHDDRKKLENEELDAVHKILGDDVTLPDFLSLNIFTLKNLLPSQKKELTRLQKELEEMNKKDQEEEKEIEQRKEEEKDDLQKASDLLGEEIELLDFLELDIALLKNLTQQQRKELQRLQDELKKLHDADIKEA